jgi:hypothetical protein
MGILWVWAKSFLYSRPCYLRGFLAFLNLYTLHDRKIRFDALLFFCVYSGLKCCQFLLYITGIRVLPRNFRNSFLFTATSRNSPPAKRVSAANRVCKDVDIFRKPLLHLNRFYANLRHFLMKLSTLFRL